MLDALIEAIIAGRLTLRQARIALAVATSGQMGARRLAAVTGIDRAHCVRTLSELEAMGWITRDRDGARPVDNFVDGSPGVCAKKAHRVCQKSTQRVPKEHTPVCQKSTHGVPKEHTCAEKAHVPKPAPDVASGRCVPKEHTTSSSSSSSSSSSNKNTTTTTTTVEVTTVEVTTAEEHTALVFPRCFTPDQQAAARRLLASLNGRAQELLDEVAGREAIHPIKNPLAYLRGLVQRARAGDFTPEAGVAVAEARRQHEAMQRVRKETDDAHLTEIKRSVPPHGSLKAALAAYKSGLPPT